MRGEGGGGEGKRGEICGQRGRGRGGGSGGDEVLQVKVICLFSHFTGIKPHHQPPTKVQ